MVTYGEKLHFYDFFQNFWSWYALPSRLYLQIGEGEFTPEIILWRFFRAMAGNILIVNLPPKKHFVIRPATGKRNLVFHRSQFWPLYYSYLFHEILHYSSTLNKAASVASYISFGLPYRSLPKCLTWAKSSIAAVVQRCNLAYLWRWRHDSYNIRR